MLLCGKWAYFGQELNESMVDGSQTKTAAVCLSYLYFISMRCGVWCTLNVVGSGVYVILSTYFLKFFNLYNVCNGCVQAIARLTFCIIYAYNAFFSAYDDARPTMQLTGPVKDFFSRDQSLCVPAEKRSPYIRQTAFVVLSAVLDRSKGTDRDPEEI